MRAVLSALAVAITAWLLAAIRGASGIARDDDWSYLAVAFSGWPIESLSLNGWVHMMFVTQALAGHLISNVMGPSVLILQLFVLILGAAGLLCVFWLSREVLSHRCSLFVILVIGLSPLWLHLSMTFMTDIPAWALSTASIVFGIKAIQGQRFRWLLIGAFLSLAGFGVREYAIVPMIAILGYVSFSRASPTFRRQSLVLAAGMLTLALAGFLWRQSIPGAFEAERVSLGESSVLVSRLAVTLGLLLAPFLFSAAVLSWSERSRFPKLLVSYWFGITLGAIFGLVVAWAASGQLSGNVIHPFGSSWTTVGDGVRSMPIWAYRGLGLIASVCLVTLCALGGLLAQRLVNHRSLNSPFAPQPRSVYARVLTFVSLFTLVVYVVMILGGGSPVFDRYLLVVVPLLGIVILWAGTQSVTQRIAIWQKCVLWLIVVVTGAIGVVVADGLNQVDGLRWQVASDLVASGIPAYKIDGGDTWFRFYQKDAPGVAQVGSLENSIPGRTWWQTFFEGSAFCRMVAIESETDLQAVYGPALSVQEERTLMGTPFRVMVFPGPDPC